MLPNGYAIGRYNFWFMLKMDGSVFPYASAIALPPALISALMRYLNEYHDDSIGDWGAFALLNSTGGTAAWSGFVFLVGFVVVFRTSQAYGRYWDALNDTHRMIAEWFDAASSLVAFTRSSKCDPQEVDEFLQVCIRLFSMLSASALQELSDVTNHNTWGLPTLDARSIDHASISTLDAAQCRVELMYQWLQQMLVDGLQSGIIAIPPPILGRTFSELASGMSKYQEALKHARVPFPLPYAQTTTMLLFFHWVLTPLVMIQWTKWVIGAALFTFIQIFMMWSLNTIALGFEKPFGGEANDIDSRGMQVFFNQQLLLLLEPRTHATPSLDQSTRDDGELGVKLRQRDTIHSAALFMEGWQVVDICRNKSFVESARPISSACKRGCAAVASYSCCCRGRLGQKKAIQQVAVAARFCQKRYAIVDGECTAVLTVGVFHHELVLALPPSDGPAKDGDVTCEVYNIDGHKCKLRMKKVSVRDRHGIYKQPDPAWETPPLDFSKRFVFRNEELVEAFSILLKTKVVPTVKITFGHIVTNTTDDKKVDGIGERLAPLDQTTSSGLQGIRRSGIGMIKSVAPEVLLPGSVTDAVRTADNSAREVVAAISARVQQVPEAVQRGAAIVKCKGASDQPAPFTSWMTDGSLTSSARLGSTTGSRGDSCDCAGSVGVADAVVSMDRFAVGEKQVSHGLPPAEGICQGMTPMAMASAVDGHSVAMEKTFSPSAANKIPPLSSAVRFGGSTPPGVVLSPLRESCNNCVLLDGDSQPFSARSRETLRDDVLS
eukprot:TRINITY_DN43270_c0_g1_i1.p1 TRINITY_DN43270_c0_g1~~TRINITY_DN43270_c0_g1_i1.p1  ORF type:complete len:807 (-),score=132.87 TRINITY_DN43270_c0_g1_i1:103-2430(-)